MFSAPCDFMPPDIFEGWPFDIGIREIWHATELQPEPQAVGWITNTGWSFRLGGDQLLNFPKLRVVVTPSTGSDHIDVKALNSSGILFRSLLDDRESLEDIAASAEHAFLLLLNSLRRLPFAAHAVDARKWRRDMEGELRGHELQGRIIGLVGFGRIGRRLARYCRAFGAVCCYYDPFANPVPGLAQKVESLKALFQCSDSIIICCTLTEQTVNLITGDLLKHMKFGATLINIARGEIIDESALYETIRTRTDIQVSLDVLRGESCGLQFESPLMDLVDQNRFTVTPHIGGSTVESQTKAVKIALRIMAQLLSNEVSQ
jgi:D-3-phosphoglycerate dehydrogenase